MLIIGGPGSVFRDYLIKRRLTDLNERPALQVSPKTVMQTTLSDGWSQGIYGVSGKYMHSSMYLLPLHRIFMAKSLVVLIESHRLPTAAQPVSPNIHHLISSLSIFTSTKAIQQQMMLQGPH